jgi:predicted TIM-barrel fold metal-dependent hydrolase
MQTTMSRRTFLYQACAAITAPLAAQTVPPPMRVIDTHTHFYDPFRPGGVPWPGKGTPLYRAVYPQDWLALAAPHGAKETIVVEASPWLEDNQWILDLAAKNPCIVGLAGNLAPQDADFAKHLKRFAANPIFRGIRVSGNAWTDNIGKAEFQSSLKLMADLGLELDINGGAALHQSAARLAADMPALRIVVNHVGSAGDAAHLKEDWLAGMKALGAQKNVFCKVSALMEQTEASNKNANGAPRETAYYLPILDHCWQCFGEDRLLYGSNWPVSDKGGTYAEQFKIVSEYFGAKGRAIAEKFFWKNSLAAYGRVL